MLPPVRPLKFVDSSQKDLRDMPATVRHALGIQLMTVQYGGEPSDFKPMQSVGAGAYEIRYRHTANGAYRVIYPAKLADAVYVLHAFQKKHRRHTKAGHRSGSQSLQETDRSTEMSENDITITDSSGNVFADLGFDPAEAEIMKLRAEVIRRLNGESGEALADTQPIVEADDGPAFELAWLSDHRLFRGSGATRNFS